MSDTDDCIAYIALAKCVKKRKKKKTRIWMKEWLKKRNQLSQEHLLNELKISAPSDIENCMLMDNSTFQELLALISPLIIKKDTLMREAIPVNQRLSTALGYIATGNSFEDLKFTTSISAVTISKIVMETCEAIISGLKGYIKIPHTQKQWKEIAKGFQDRWNFPNCLGAVDGKHIAIKKPSNSGSLYYNYKKFFSVVLMAVVDSNYEFIVADVDINERVSEGGAFGCSFGKDFLRDAINLPKPELLPSSGEKLPYVFIGDDAFQLTPNFMKPFSQTGSTGEEQIFNYRLSRARRTVDNAFGILATRFGIFQRPIQLSPEKVQTVVLACCYLHNFLRRKVGQKYMPIGSIDSENIEMGTITPGLWRGNKELLPLQKTISHDSSNKAKNIRELYCKYFNNEGQVPWQQNFTQYLTL